MTHRAALTSLCAVACLALLLGGAAHPLIAPVCLAILALKAFVLDTRRRFIPDLPFTLLHAGLFLPGIWLALLNEPPLPFFDLLVTFGGPLLVLRSLARETPFNDFLITLMSLLLAVLSAAAAEGWMPLGITALYLFVACQALPHITARKHEAVDGDVSVRLLGATGWWSSAPMLAAHHLALAGLLVGAAVYLLVPRPAPAEDAGSLADADALAERRRLRGGTAPGGDWGAVTGFPREVNLGDIGEIKQRPGVVLTTEVRRRGRLYDPGPEGLLLRARIWDRYDPGRRRWVTPSPRSWRLADGGRLETGDTALHWTVQLLGSDRKTLFLPQRPRVVRSPARRLYVDNLGVVTSRSPVEEYAVESAEPVTDLESLRPDPRFDRLLEIPRALQVQQLHRHLPKRTGTSVRHCLLAIRDHFAREGFRYTLSLPESLDAGKDPVVAFLERREGHCELYASAACFFLRYWRIPARVVGGYRLAERTGPGRYRAQYRNAHAWVEIACLGVGFVAVDFTPENDRSPAATGSGAAHEGAAAAGAGTGGTSGGIDWSDPFRYGPREQEHVARWVYGRLVSPVLLAALGALLFAVVLWGALVAGRRRVRDDPLRVRAPKGVPRRTLAFYARWLKECAAQGHRRRRAQTPREFLHALPTELHGEGRKLTLEFERRRYGGGA